MKTKVIKIYLRTWRQLRSNYKGIRGETIAEYIDRILVEMKNDRKQALEEVERHLINSRHSNAYVILKKDWERLKKQSEKNG